MRVDYDAAHTRMALPQFEGQRYCCTARNLKCQKESLLIFLQTATQQKLISPLPFVHPADNMSGFLGWTGFHIMGGCGDKFRCKYSLSLASFLRDNQTEYTLSHRSLSLDIYTHSYIYIYIPIYRRNRGPFPRDAQTEYPLPPLPTSRAR